VSWVRLDDTLHSHPKVLDAGLEALGLWALALSHCGAYLTDGHVRRAAAMRLAGAPDVLERLASTLVRVGLWEVHPSGDGWQVHDFLAYNPSRAEVQSQRSDLSEKRAEAGRKGAASRWHRDGTANAKPHGNGVANADGKDGNCHGPDHGPVPSRPDPDPDPIPSAPSEPLALTSEAPAKGRSKRATKKPETPAPATGASQEELDDWTRKWAIPQSDPAFRNFLLHARTHDRRCRDWSSAWAMWKSKEHEFARPNGVHRNGYQADPPSGREWDADEGGAST
jgi:hypothetical protein